jgi:hypothetical protein
MTRHSLPLFVSIALLGLVPTATETRAQDFPANKNDGDRLSVTRSDGSVGRVKPPDQREIRKLVGYMRDGMNRADRSEKQKQYKRAIRIRK